MEVLKQLERRDGKPDLRTLPSLLPYARFMGFEVDLKGNEVTARMPYKRDLIGNARLPALHGGTIGALLEWTAVVQLLFDTECARLPKTIGITVNYLRSGRPVDTYARALVTKHGRRVANVQVSAWQDDRDRPIASANGNFLLQPS